MWLSPACDVAVPRRSSGACARGGPIPSRGQRPPDSPGPGCRRPPSLRTAALVPSRPLPGPPASSSPALLWLRGGHLQPWPSGHLLEGPTLRSLLWEPQDSGCPLRCPGCAPGHPPWASAYSSHPRPTPLRWPLRPPPGHAEPPRTHCLSSEPDRDHRPPAPQPEARPSGGPGPPALPTRDGRLLPPPHEDPGAVPWPPTDPSALAPAALCCPRSCVPTGRSPGDSPQRGTSRGHSGCPPSPASLPRALQGVTRDTLSTWEASATPSASSCPAASPGRVLPSGAATGARRGQVGQVRPGVALERAAPSPRPGTWRCRSRSRAARSCC